MLNRIPKSLRPLTHGYAAWGVYATMGVTTLKENWSLFGDVPWWATLLMLGAVLALRVVKQDSVSGADEAEDDE